MLTPSLDLLQHIREMIILFFLKSISEVICVSHSRISRSDAEIPREYEPEVTTGSEKGNHFNLVSEMLDPVINLTNVLVSEFEKIDNRLDEMLENVDDLMARDLRSRRTRGI